MVANFSPHIHALNSTGGGSWSNVGKDIGGFWRGLSITLNDSYLVYVESRKTSEIHSEFIPASF